MSTRQFGKSWWVDFRYNRQRYRKRSPENSRNGAAAYEAVLRQKLARGEDIDNVPEENKEPEKRFDTFSLEWLEIYASPNNRPTTMRSKEMIIRVHLVPHFKATTLGRIGNLEIEKLKSLKLREGLAPKSINNILSVLHTCLNSAVEWGYLQTMPRIAWIKVPPQRFDFLTVEEARKLLRDNPDSWWHDMILCALHTGMRLGELSALEWQDIDLDRRMITVQRSLVEGVTGSPKNNRIRHLPMTTDVHRILMGRRKNRGSVFTRKDGSPLQASYSWRGLRDACKRSGLRRIGWHTLRHTFASHLAMRGAPMRTIQSLLGHASIQMSERYSHLSPASLQTAISLLETHHEILDVEDSGQQVGKILELNTAQVA